MTDPRQRLKIALDARDVERAVEAAQPLRPLDLLEALDVLTLLAETGDWRYPS